MALRTKTICLCLLGIALSISAKATQPVLVDEKLVEDGKIDIRPNYPAEAQAQRWTGNGVFVLHVDPRNGRVRSIEIEKSTGHKVLDDASVTAFNSLRFRPGTGKVTIPVTFTMPAQTDGPRVTRNFPATWLAEQTQFHTPSGHSLGTGKK